MFTIEPYSYTPVNFKKTPERHLLKRSMGLLENNVGSQIHLDVNEKKCSYLSKIGNRILNFLENNWAFRLLDIITGVRK